MVDEAKIHQFIGQMLSDLGGAASVALVRMGDALGLYKTLHAQGPMTVAELAAAAGVNERYLREWASHQAASNYLSYDPATQKFALPEEHGGIVAWLGNQEKVQPAFKNAAHRGEIRPPACSVLSRGFSARAITTTWSATGCRRSTASSPNCSAGPRLPMSGARMAGLPC
jgi:hypothetical protein